MKNPLVATKTGAKDLKATQGYSLNFGLAMADLQRDCSCVLAHSFTFSLSIIVTAEVS